MKKLFAILVAAMLVMAMSVTAFGATASIITDAAKETTAEVASIAFALPEGLTLETGDVVTVHIKGKATNDKVRIYFTDNVDNGRVNDVVAIDVVDGAFETTVDIVIDASGAIQGTAAPTVLLLKGPSYGVNLTDVSVEVVEITCDKIVAEEAPVEEAPAEEAPAEDGYTAFLMFATSSWYPAAMEAADHNSVTVTGNGTYTIETDQLAGSSDALVFCVDIMDILVDHPNVTAVLDSIEVDGEVVEFNADAVQYGDIEQDNDHYRIEIRNEYGATLDTVITGWQFAIDSTIKVTFTVSGMEDVVEAPAEEETPAVEDTPAAEDTPAEEEPADTGLALAVVPMIVAAAAVVLSKKR